MVVGFGSFSHCSVPVTLKLSELFQLFGWIGLFVSSSLLDGFIFTMSLQFWAGS